MELTITSRGKKLTWLCALVYFASYLTRNNFSVMLVSVVGDTGFSKGELAVVVTAMTIFYGVGQIVNGFIGDKLSPRIMLSVGLLLSGACNICMFTASSIGVMVLLWSVNGYAQAMLWPPIVRLFSDNLNEVEYGYASVRVSWGSSFATVLLYTLSPLLLKFLNWRTVTLIYAVSGIAVAVIWMLSTRGMDLGSSCAERDDSCESSGSNTAGGSGKLGSIGVVLLSLIFSAIILMGILRDGVTNWMPSFLLESFGLAEEDAIFATVILAVFSIISFYVFNLIHQRFLRNEVLCSAVIFGCSALAALVLWFISAQNSSIIVSMLLMAVIVACMHGVNLMLIVVVPKRLKFTGRVSLYSGILNSGTYIGASVSTYGVAVISEAKGWNFTIFLWAAVSVLGAAICLTIAKFWKSYAIK